MAQLEARVVQLEVSGAVTIIDWVIVIKVRGMGVLDSVHVGGGKLTRVGIRLSGGPMEIYLGGGC